jgi:predicted hotdog family 3-hydroxylacyl-ACP dehydratase
MGEDLSWVVAQMPHQPPMRFIDEVVEVEDARILCKCRLHDAHIMVVDGSVTPLVAIELFAQAAAALMVHRAAQAGAPPTGGFLLGTRKVDVNVDVFRPGDELTVDVKELWGSGALAQFECVLTRDGAEVATGSINVASAAGPPPEAATG